MNFLSSSFACTRPQSRRVSLPLALVLGLVLTLVLSGCGELNQSYEVGVYLDAPFAGPKVEGLKQGLKALGYSEGSTLRFQLFDPSQVPQDQLNNKLQEFAAKGYPVYWTSSNQGALALNQAGLAKPLIVAGLTNPVQTGLVKNYYRPATNLNGVDSLNTELTLNRLNLLLSFDPSIRKVYLLYDATSPADVNYLPTLRAEAARLGIALLEKPLQTKAASKDMVSQLKASEASAILTLGDSVFEDKLDLVALKSVVTQEKLVLVGLDRTGLDFGALFSYGTDFNGLGRQSAAYVDRVLHGVSPATMPLLQPTQLELVLNQKLAIQIGRKFSDEEVATADDVIN